MNKNFSISKIPRNQVKCPIFPPEAAIINLKSGKMSEHGAARSGYMQLGIPESVQSVTKSVVRTIDIVEAARKYKYMWMNRFRG